MSWFQSSFQRAEGLYSRLFGNWLHINFIVRTVLLVLMLWIIIYVATLAFKHIVGPFLAWIYINFLLRAWNFLVTETVQEWIYIHHYSKGSPRFSAMYLRLTDKIKHNHMVLSGDEENKALRRKRIRRFGNQAMIAAAVIAAMWVTAFGINQEYTAPAWVGSGDAGQSGTQDNNPHDPDGEETNYETENGEAPTNGSAYTPGMVRPGQLPEGAQISLVLTVEAREGARLRSGPGTADTVVIEMLWGDELLVYLGYYVADADVDTLYWMRVRSASGTIGYIGSHLVELAAG